MDIVQNGEGARHGLAKADNHPQPLPDSYIPYPIRPPPHIVVNSIIQH